jgi:hypothetical protein
MKTDYNNKQKNGIFKLTCIHELKIKRLDFLSILKTN